MAAISTASLAGVVRAAARPLTGDAHDYDGLLDRIGERSFALLGEASHGTHEFYRERARITRRLIAERGFNAVAVEADWPDAYRVNRWVRGEGDDPDAASALAGFRRFPTWMWRSASALARRDGRAAVDELFFAEQNARLVKNAEEYYREMFRGRVSSWNLRDRHMTETLEALARHMGHSGGKARIAVWEHNSHLG